MRSRRYSLRTLARSGYNEPERGGDRSMILLASYTMARSTGGREQSLAAVPGRR